MKKKTIIRYIIMIVISLLALFNIYNFINMKLFKNDLTTFSSYALLEMNGNSMNPIISNGDLVIINVDNQEYNVGDVIAYKDSNDTIITSRILTRDGNLFITKGDASNKIENTIKESSIIGKYHSSIPYLGTLLSNLKNPFILALLGIIAFLICTFLSMDVDTLEESSVIVINKNNKNKKKNIPKKAIYKRA